MVPGRLLRPFWRPPGVWAISVLVAVTASACQTPAANPAKPHHVPGGFRNNAPHVTHGFLGLPRWRWDQLTKGIPPRPEGGYRFPIARNDPAALRENRSRTTLTWIGHASFLLQVNGVNILTDPQFSERASPFSWIGPRRVTAPGLAPEALPPIEVVVISHNHYDHLDIDTVKFLHRRGAPGKGPRFFVPLGLKAWFAKAGITDVVELDWWEKAEYRGLVFHSVPVQHFSARTLFDRNETLWTGWVVATSSWKFFFAGDAGYSRDFQEIARRLGPIDLAALPIGAYEPRWFMGAMHLNPEEAVRAYLELGSRTAVAMHWGTFDLTDEPPDEPPNRLGAALQKAGIPSERFFLMQHGETRTLD